MLLVSETRPLLKTKHFGRAWRGFETMGSTNIEAARWLADGAPEGAVVISEVQTSGRGRLDRTWEAQPGLNLLLSVVLRPRLAPERLGLITLAAGVAVAETVETFTAPLAPTIKWPNDILLEDRKVCGMLLESGIRAGATDPAVVLGIGLNVNQVNFPEPIAATATSLRLATGRLIPRPPLLAHLLGCLETRYRQLHSDARQVREAYTSCMARRGHSITLIQTSNDDRISGTVIGIDANGALQLEVDGRIRTFHAGETTIAKPNRHVAHS